MSPVLEASPPAVELGVGADESGFDADPCCCTVGL
jgi:hypothetical protein